jgi:hypothetical protein
LPGLTTYDTEWFNHVADEYKALEGLEESADGSVVVPLDDWAAGEEEAPLSYDEDAPNLAEVFASHPDGKIAAKKIVEKVIDDCDTDQDGGAEYRKHWADNWKICSGHLPEKLQPFRGCANAHVPLFMTILSRLVASSFGELYGDWNQVVTFKPLGPDGYAEATKATLHTNWQLRNQIINMPREEYRCVTAFFFGGDVSSRSWWNPVTGTNCHETLTPDELITPFVYTTTAPDYSDLPHYTLIMHKNKHELERMDGEWFDVQKVIDGEPPSWDDEPDQEMTRVISEIQGVDAPSESTSAPHKILHYEGWLDLPNQNKQRWCQVIVHYQSRALLKLCILEEVSWEEKRRVERQTQEKMNYEQQMLLYQQGLAQAEQQVAVAQGMHDQAIAAGIMDPQQAMASQQAIAAQASQPKAPPPQPPAWLLNSSTGEPEPPKKVPVYLFAHAVNFEPLVGNLGMGPGNILADLNRAANVLMSQYTDAATLGNVEWFFTTDQVNFEQPFKIGPGVMNKVRGMSGQELKDSIMPMGGKPANPQMMQMVTLFKQMAEGVASADGIMSGLSGKSGETAKGQASRLEQATKQLSVGSRRIGDMFLQKMKNNAWLNSIYGKDDEIIQVSDNITGMQEIQVTRAMYERNYKVELRSDLRFTSLAEKIVEADEVVQMTMKVPVLMQNAEAQFLAVQKALEVRGHYDIVQAMIRDRDAKIAQAQAQQQAAAQAQAMGLPPPAPPGMPPQGQPQQGPPQGQQPQRPQPQGGPPPGQGRPERESPVAMNQASPQ